MSDINHAPVDRYTLLHALIGLGLGAAGASGPVTAGVAVGWELIERELKESHPEMFPHPSQDTLENAALDAGAVMAGWYAGSRSRR